MNSCAKSGPLIARVDLPTRTLVGYYAALSLPFLRRRWQRRVSFGRQRALSRTPYLPEVAQKQKSWFTGTASLSALLGQMRLSVDERGLPTRSQGPHAAFSAVFRKGRLTGSEGAL